MNQANESKNEPIKIMKIIGKYFLTNKDFINLMKTTKKYQTLNENYSFNPISDCSLFPNIQTQHFYKKEDAKNKQADKKYVYWYDVDYEVYKKKKENECYMRVELNKKRNSSDNEYLLPIEDGKCKLILKKKYFFRIHHQMSKSSNVELH